MEPTSASEAGGSPPPGRGSGPGRGRGRGRGQGRGSNHGRAASSRHAPKPTSITAEGMEQTSESEMSHSPPNGLGRGPSNARKRHSQGASSSHAPKPKKASRKARGQIKKLKSLSWLRKTALTLRVRGRRTPPSQRRLVVLLQPLPGHVLGVEMWSSVPARRNGALHLSPQAAMTLLTPAVCSPMRHGW